MGRKFKKTGLVIILLIGIGISVGYFIWNKPLQDIASQSGLKISAVDLYNGFINDSTTAKLNYTDKVLEVNGVISSVSVNQQQQAIVLLKTNTKGAFINCTIEQTPNNLKEGMTTKIKGICTGLGMSDADLGIVADVYLIRCYLVK